MSNLLKETVGFMRSLGKKPEDVLWVGGDKGGRGDKFVGSWDDFCDLAADIEYYDGYGGKQINLYLKVVGDNWWLERGEYDGADWWEFKTIPVRQLHAQKMRKSDILEG